MIGSRRRHAFSLLELLVVIAIVGILTALSAAAVQRVRETGNRARCADHLRQIGMALHHYHDVQGVFPSGVSYKQGKDPQPFMSWQTRLLPFLEQQAAWDQAVKAFEKDKRFLHVPPHVLFATVMPAFTCPSDGRTLVPGQIGPITAGLTSFLGVEGTDQLSQDGLLYLDSRTRLADVTDGTSQTLLVGERPPSADLILGWWYAGEGQSKDGSGDMVLGVLEQNISVYGVECPTGPFEFGLGRVKNQCDAFHFWSVHPGGAHFLFADGDVRFLRYSAAGLMPLLATRAGGESIPDTD